MESRAFSKNTKCAQKQGLNVASPLFLGKFVVDFFFVSAIQPLLPLNSSSVYARICRAGCTLLVHSVDWRSGAQRKREKESDCGSTLLTVSLFLSVYSKKYSPFLFLFICRYDFFFYGSLCTSHTEK